MSRIVDNLIAVRVLTLLNISFRKWKAFELGIIDEKGKTIRSANTPEDKKAWTYLHRVIRKVKQLLDRVPGARIAASIYALRESVTPCQYDLIESMISGSSTDTHSGENSGAISHDGPHGFDKKKKKTFEEHLTETAAMDKLMADLKAVINKGKKLSTDEKQAFVDRLSIASRYSSSVDEDYVMRIEDLIKEA